MSGGAKSRFKQLVPGWVIPALVLFSVGTVWLRLSTVGTTYEINQTDKLIFNARKEQEKIKFRVSRLRAPENLERLAKRKFNLSSPDSSQVIRMPAGN